MRGWGGFCPEPGALFNAETMLFVDDHEAELVELYVVFDECVGAYDELGFAGGNALLDAFLLGGLEAADEEFDGDVKSVEHAEKGVVVLGGENFGRRHEAGLAPVVECKEHAHEGDEGFPASDIALQEAVHLVAGAHVLAYFLDYAFLGIGERKGNFLVVEAVEMVADGREDAPGGVVLS